MSDDRSKDDDKLFLDEYTIVELPLAPERLAHQLFGMLEELGMAKDATRFIHYKPGASFGYTDFRLEAYGVLGDIPVDLEKPPDGEPKTLRRAAGLYLSIPIEGGREVTCEVWGQRIFRKGISAYIEEVWISHRLTWLRGIMRTGDPRLSDSIKQIKELSDGYSLLTHLHKQDLRGGDTRRQEIQNIWADEGMLRKFAKKVDEIKPVWAAIKEMADPCASKKAEEEWLSGMLERPVIQGFMARYPKLTKDLLRRAVDGSLKPVNREPRQLAFFHAAVEVEVNIDGEKISIIDAYLKYQDRPLAPTSLKNYYDRGKALQDSSE